MACRSTTVWAERACLLGGEGGDMYVNIEGGPKGRRSKKAAAVG